MKVKIILGFHISCMIFLLQSCGIFNLYEINYSEITNPGKIPEKVTLSDGQEPQIKILESTEQILKEVNSSIPQGYYIIGYSEFSSSANIDKYSASVLAKKLGATKIILARSYSHSTTQSYSVPGTTGYEYKGKYFTEKVESTPNSSVQYDKTMYYHAAVFMVKSRYQPNYGIIVSHLSNEQRSNFKRNLGVIVNVVFTNSYMYNANIIEGDIIIKLNGFEIKNEEDFNFAINSIEKYAKDFNIELLRDGETLNIQVNLE